MLAAFVAGVREPSMILVVASAILFETQVMGSGLGSILVSLLFFYRALASLLSVQTFYNSFLGTSGSMENMKDFQENIDKINIGTSEYPNVPTILKYTELPTPTKNIKYCSSFG